MLWLIPRYSQINHSFKKDLITFRRKLFFIEVPLISNILSVSDVQHSDSEFLQIVSHYRLLQNIGVYLKKTDFFFSWSKFSFFRKEGCGAFFLTRTQGEEKIGKWRLEPNLRMLQRRQSKLCPRKRVIWSLMCASHPASPLVLYSASA